LQDLIGWAAKRLPAVSPADRLEEIAAEPRPGTIAFGKAAYEGPFREKPARGLQGRRLGAIRLFVLPSTSPADAAVPYVERLSWFRDLRDLAGP